MRGQTWRGLPVLRPRLRMAVHMNTVAGNEALVIDGKRRSSDVRNLGLWQPGVLLPPPRAPPQRSSSCWRRDPGEGVATW
jgi:hypothetical protein